MKLFGKTIEYQGQQYAVTGYNLLKNEYNLQNTNTGKYIFEDIDAVESLCTVLEED